MILVINGVEGLKIVLLPQCLLRIVIQNEADRANGFGKEALKLLIDYSFNQLQLHQLYANIGVDNVSSLNLFATFGFQKIGIKKDWIFNENTYQDEAIYQLINHLQAF